MNQPPRPLRRFAVSPFVGRSVELETLRTLLPTATGEGRRLALVGGEPGSGKSRLVREFAAEAAAQGSLVLQGACDAVVQRPYGPFAEALDQLARTLEAGTLRAALGPGGGELTRLLPDLPARVGELPAPVSADADTERHRLHTAVTDLLMGVTRERPALLVIEDGHWADAPTLLLLRHLGQAARGARVLILATFRDTEAHVPELLAETLADLRRSDDVVRLRLGGLSAEEVAELVLRSFGGPLEGGHDQLARTIQELTQGNPFLVCELWRSLVETEAVEVVDGSIRLARSPAELESPESVREVVKQRQSRLSPATADLLELAATAGTEFEFAVVQRAAGELRAQLPAALDESLASGMIEELPGPGLRYGFTHELVRRALYDRLSSLRRAELHLRVGEALEASGEGGGRALAELAHHFTAAAPFGGAERGVRYNLLAARAAADGLSFAEAAARLEAALALGVEAPPERAAVFLDLGTAHHRGGRAVDSLAAFRAAAEIARELDDSELLVRAAIGYENACWRPGIADEGAVELLEEAAAAIGEEPSELRVRLLNGLARALDYQGQSRRGAGVRSQAIAMARRLGDRVGLAAVLTSSYWSRTASSEEVLEMLAEAGAIGSALGDTEIRTEAMAWRVPSLVAVSAMEAARDELADLRELSEQTAQPFVLYVAEQFTAAIALLDGRLGEAADRARRSREWSRLLIGRDESGAYGLQMFSIRREQGRLAELAPVIRVLAADHARAGPWQPGLAALLAELGMQAEARDVLARVTRDGLKRLRESLWLVSLTYLADACSALGEREPAELLYRELLPLAGANVMIGHLVCCYGAADRYLGMLAGTLGETARAEEHFQRAMEHNRRMRAATWLAHTAYEYARVLTRAGAERRGDADALLAQAATLAERIGMPSLLARVHALGAASPGGLPDGLSAREAQILRLVARGLSNRQIGSALSISEHTAANHVRSILRKTRCANRTEATSYAHRHGLAPS